MSKLSVKQVAQSATVVGGAHYENMLVASSVTLPYKLVCRAREAAKAQGLSLSKWLVPVIAEKLNKIPSSAD